MAMSLGLPVYGCAPTIQPRIGPPPCEDYGGWAGHVLDKDGKGLANVEVTLTMFGQTRVYKTDDEGQFSIPGSGAEVGPGTASATIPGHVVNRVEMFAGGCRGPRIVSVQVDREEPIKGSNSIVD